jgi:hypothetical protein
MPTFSGTVSIETEQRVTAMVVGVSSKFDAQFDFPNFVEEVQNEWRFTRSPNAMQLLKRIEETLTSRVLPIEIGDDGLWRAQLGCDWVTESRDENEPISIPNAYAKDRMKPRRQPYGVTEGRVNPIGIPCLYLATSQYTAVCEVRPLPGSLVTVAQFKIRRDLKIVDCCRFHDRQINYHKPPQNEDEYVNLLWTQIDQSFSHLTTGREFVAEYAPTQIIAELFRRNGYDGLAYQSNFYESASKEAYNLALFDLNAAECLEPQVFQVTDMRVSYKPFWESV